MSEYRIIGTGLLGAIVAMLIHASVEFNQQIPAYSATFVTDLAMVWLVRHLTPAPE